jgi:hypothetical protein
MFTAYPFKSAAVASLASFTEQPEVVALVVGNDQGADGAGGILLDRRLRRDVTAHRCGVDGSKLF